MKIQDKLEQIASGFDLSASDDEASFLGRQDVEYLNRQFSRQKNSPEVADNESDEEWVDEDEESYDESLDETIVESSEEEKMQEPDVEPPAFLKSKTIVYIIKTFPVLVMILFLMVIARLASAGSYYDNIVDLGLVHHKFRGFEKKLGEIGERLEQLSNTHNNNDVHKLELIEEQIQQLQKNEHISDREIKHLVQNAVIEFLQESLDEKLEQLVSDKMGHLDSVMEERISQLEIEKLTDKMSHEVLEKVDTQISSVSSQLEALQSAGYSEQEIETTLSRLVQHEFNQRLEPRVAGISNYASYDRGARVLKKYTTLPKLKRVRTKVVDRVLHGWLDFIRRTIQGHKRTLTGLNNVELTSSENSPANVLVDSSQYWQALAQDLPITFGVQLSEPVYLRQVGLYHPRVSSLAECAPRHVSLLVEPANSKQAKLLRNKLAIYYNQDLVFSHLRGLAKVSEFEFQASGGQSYQTFPFSREILMILDEFPVKNVVLVVEDNWGHKEVVVLYGLKVFGLNEFEMKATRVTRSDEIINLGEDSVF
ncbi:hypothetical protein KL911_003137 [Ogataea haglerorum]|uniref:uncharacterized protein n=1 Tax=Ogataea haglerorum TaxID=1937702 RepID=UPI001C8A7779|nr:uncharacterized protein KL911_003137 [Ogataea haglerorum]KAG7753032.1 hypothetical protein KL911_003137 [Ogataea haglerorum]